MSNYETVKELAQGFAKVVQETKESMWTLSAKVEAQDKQYKAVLAAVQNLNVNTIPEFEIDWAEILEMAEGLEDGHQTAQHGVESAQSEVEGIEDQLNSATSEMEYAVSHADDLGDEIQALAFVLRDIKEKLDDNAALSEDIDD